jgi:amidohydrolase
LQNNIKGQVKFIFQPSEEKINGAARMIRAGALERPRAEAIFALHVDPEIDFGKISCVDGPIYAAADRFAIEIIGRGGHAANHYLCIDPISVANQVYSGLQSIERNLHGWDARVISVCSIHGGTAFNIIPDRVTMEGTVRTYDKKAQAVIIRRMREIVAGIAAAHGAKWKISYAKGVPATVNHQKMARLFREAARAMGSPIVNKAPGMVAEDFSCYQQKIPGAMAMIGIRTRKNCPSLHNNHFDAGDRILPLGAELLAKCALAGLHGEVSE